MASTPETTVADKVFIPEIVAAEETALAERSQQSLLERLARAATAQGAAALDVIEDRIRMLERIRRAAISRTNPEDWVLTRGQGGQEFGMLKESGCRVVAETYGIQVRPTPPATSLEPEKITHGSGGVYSYRIRATAWSPVTGQEVSYEAERRSDEKFTGRAVDADNRIVPRDGLQALDADLRSSTYTLATTNKPARLLGNMVRVAKTELQAVWGSNKSAENCEKGPGYGTSQERGAQRVAEEGVAGNAEDLWKEILRRVSGDESAAHDLLREITAYPAGKNKKTGEEYRAFAGNKSWQEITRANSLKFAWEKLRKHPTFGDQAQGGEREPGQDG